MTDRRREKLLPARWPTAAEAQAGRWFTPVRIGPLTLSSRTWVPAMVPWRATDDGLVTDEVVRWYRRFAQGEPGAIVIEATGIRDVPSGPLLRAGHDRFVDGLARVADAIHEGSAGKTKALVQLIDFLAIKRRPTPEKFLSQHLRLTPAHRERLGGPWLTATDEAVRAQLLTLDEARLSQVLDEREFEALRMGLRERVTDVHLPHVADLPRVLPQLFADAARRCERAGFDGVELHCAHAYTLASFLSKKNDRADGYGGSREGRLRLPLEVYQATRGALGPHTALGCRFLADEIIAGGSDVDDAQAYAVAFAQAGMDFVSLSRGGKFEDAKQPKVGQAAYPYTGPSGHECMPTTKLGPPGPWGRNAGAVAQIRRAVREAGHTTPIVVCGGIATFDQAEALLHDGSADIVASARQALADPDWVKKVRLGRGDEVRRCLFTNYCEGLDQSHEVVTCQLWDRLKGAPDDATASRTKDGRRTTAPAWTPSSS